jgi:Barstar (barnase inhibitor)
VRLVLGAAEARVQAEGVGARVIQILHDMKWSPEWNVTKHNRVVADLRNCSDEACVLGSIGAAVKHPDYPGYAKSLNTLPEYLIDWFGARWGKKAEIYLRGAEAMNKARPDLIDDVIDVMTSAFDHVARFRLEDDCDKAVAWDRIKIVICFS